jgi:hypothetical protein
MKVKWKDLLAFAQQSETYSAGHKDETKVNYAIKRVKDQIVKHQEKLQEMMGDIEIDLCAVDDKDIIQRDAQGNLQFTREALKERNKRQRGLLEQEFEIEPFYVEKMPDDLTPEQFDAFSHMILSVTLPEDREDISSAELVG